MFWYLINPMISQYKNLVLNKTHWIWLRFTQKFIVYATESDMIISGFSLNKSLI